MMKLMTCTKCGRELPDEQFELYPTGTRRHVCNRCKYRCYTRPAYHRYILRQVDRHAGPSP